MSRATSEGLVVFKMPSPAMLLGAEVRSLAARRALSAELLGTLLLVFFAAGTMIVTGGMLGEKLSSSRLMVSAMAHGLAFGLIAFAMSGVSGGHLNPILTLAAVVARRMPLARGMWYLVAQLLGAFLGAMLLKFSLPAGVPVALGLPMVGPRITAEGALIVEGLLAFSLAIVFMISAGKGTAPVAVGLMTALGRLFGAALTGAPMNPALVFGVALAAGIWTNHWLWWLGPMMGALLAAVCWRLWLGEGDGHRAGAEGRTWR
jgi:glycerol uptake facilitator-like aquaporin